MATQGMFNFDMMNPNMIKEQYIKSQLSPEAGYGERAGAQMGYSLGRLFGGKAPQEIEQQTMKEIFSAAAQQTQDPVERLALSAQGFRERGMEGRAMQLEQSAAQLQTQQAAATKERALAEKATQEAREKQAAAAAKQVGIKGRITIIKKTFPAMTEEEATAMAEDPKFAADLLAKPKEEFKEVTVDGEVRLYKQTPQGYELVQTLGKKGKTSMDSMADAIGGLAGAIGAERAKKAGGAEGAVVGKEVAQIQSGYNALSAIQDSIKKVDEGIFAGGYGPTSEAATKYTKGFLGDQKKLENTEAFRAYIGKVVIPMMAQLGGSDSNEELKYMRSIVGGDTKLEAGSIKAILARAAKAVENDIARIQAQQKAVESGASLPTGKTVEGAVGTASNPIKLD